MVQTRKKNNNKKTRQRRKRRTNRGGMFRSRLPKSVSHKLVSTLRNTSGMSRELMDSPISSINIPYNLSSNTDLLLNNPDFIRKLQEKMKNTPTPPPSIPKTEKEILTSLEEKIKRELEQMFQGTPIESIDLSIEKKDIDKHQQLRMKNIALVAISGIEKQVQVEYDTYKTPEGTYEPTSINFNTLDAKIALSNVEVERIKTLCQQVKKRIKLGESIYSAVMWGMYQAKDYKTIYYTLKWCLIMIIAVIAALKELNDKLCKTESNLNDNNNCKLITSLKENLERAINNPANIEDPTLLFQNDISIGELHQTLKEVIKTEHEEILYKSFFSKTPTSGLFPQYDPVKKSFALPEN